MSAAKVTVSMDPDLLRRVDLLVQTRVFRNRSHAIQSAVEDKVARVDRSRLARECAKLTPEVEQEIADFGLAAEADEWPEY